MSITLEIKFRDVPIDIKVHHYDPGSPGRVAGDPNDCFPPEASELDYNIDTGDDLLNELLLEHHEEEIEELVIDAIEQDKIDALDAEADAAYSRMKDENF